MSQSVLLSRKGATKAQIATALATPGDPVQAAADAPISRDVVPRIDRLGIIPPVVDNAIATITVASSSQISGSVLVTTIDPRIRTYGPPATIRTTTHYEHLAPAYPEWPNGSVYARQEFMFYGDKIELLARPNAAALRVRVNGKLVTATMQNMTNSGTDQFTLIDLGSEDLWHLMFENQTLFYDGYRIGPTDTIFQVPYDGGEMVVFQGDSFWAGAGSDPYKYLLGDAGWRQIADLLGWRNIWATAYGGTGYTAQGPSNASGNYRDRFADIAEMSPTIVWIEGGLNDSAGTPSVVAAAFVAHCQAIKALPTVKKLIVTGPQIGSTGSIAGVTAINTAFRGVLASSGVDLYIDTIAGQWVAPQVGKSSPVYGGWLTGTGSIDAPAGTGNADVFRNTDHVHPTPERVKVEAMRMVSYYRDALPF